MKAYKKMQSGQFGLDDMLSQMQQLRKLTIRNYENDSGMPKLPKMNDEDSEKKLKMTESIIFSMTKEERRDQSIITLSRKERIAKGWVKMLQQLTFTKTIWKNLKMMVDVR